MRDFYMEHSVAALLAFRQTAAGTSEAKAGSRPNVMEHWLAS
jgi:hypothetical protein